MTKKQGKVLDFIKRYHHVHKFAPTLREIAESFEININAARQHVASLERKGLIKRTEGIHRSIEVLK